MRAGRLRNKIVVQTNTPTQSGSGALTDVWSTYATVRSEINPKGGREYFDAKQVNAEIDIIFNIRYYSGVTSKMRISWNSRTFDIQSVINPMERNIEMLIACKESV